jgi:hypothetical protein
MTKTEDVVASFARGPSHLLLLAEAFADYLIHGRLYKARADAFARAVALAIVGPMRTKLSPAATAF